MGYYRGCGYPHDRNQMLASHVKVQSFDATERNFQFVLDAYADPGTLGSAAVVRL